MLHRRMKPRLYILGRGHNLNCMWGSRQLLNRYKNAHIPSPSCGHTCPKHAYMLRVQLANSVTACRHVAVLIKILPPTALSRAKQHHQTICHTRLS